MAGRNAKFRDYLTRWLDPYVDIKDGYLVNKQGVRLSDEAADYAQKRNIATQFTQFGGSPLGFALTGLPLCTGKYGDTVEDLTYSPIISQLDNVGDDFWNSLSGVQKRNFLEQYGSALDFDTVNADLAALRAIGAAPDMAMPVMSDYIDSSEDLYRDIDAELSGDYDSAYNRLNSEVDLMRQSFDDQLRFSADTYNRQASELLSNQYLSNAQTYDALQSDMRKARQNALEAGASAGIRLAGNVNALLSAQNKQAQTSMDTSNALAEMLLQQRNAAAGIRSDYRGYMSDVNQRRTDLDTQKRTERENLYNQRHSAQVNDYDTAMGDFQTKSDAWSDRFNNMPASNKFTSAYQNYMRNKSINNQGG